jgi:hypothetical protein
MEQNKPSVTAIIDRMKTVLGIQLDKELSELLGGSRGFVSVIKNRGTVPYDECVKVALEKNVSLDWLILGRGDMHQGGPLPAPIEPNLAIVPFFDASLGWEGARWDGGKPLEGESWFVPRQWLEDLGTDAADTIAVLAAGDEMAPTISADQVVLVHVGRQSTDGVYLVRIGQGVHFRRIQHLTDGTLRLSCDNPAYTAEVVPAIDGDQLEVIGYCHSIVRAVR